MFNTVRDTKWFEKNDPATAITNWWVGPGVRVQQVRRLILCVGVIVYDMNYRCVESTGFAPYCGCE